MGTFIDSRTNTLTAENTFGDPIAAKRGGILTLSGTWTATVSLQRRGANAVWVDVTNNSGTATTFTANGTYTVSPMDVPANFRFGVKTGNFTSGSIVGTIEAI